MITGVDSRPSEPGDRRSARHRTSSHGWRLAPSDGDESPPGGGRLGDIGPAQGAEIAAPHPGHESSPAIAAFEPVPLEGDLVGLHLSAASAAARAGGEVCGPEGAGP